MNRRRFLQAVFGSLVVLPALSPLGSMLLPKAGSIDSIPGLWVDYESKTIHGTGEDAQYTVLELHRWLQGLVDRPHVSGCLDITDRSPSTRITDSIIQLDNGWVVDEDAAPRLCGGSIAEKDVLWSSSFSWGTLA